MMAKNATTCITVPMKMMLIPSTSESCAPITKTSTDMVQRKETSVAFFSLASSVRASRGRICRPAPIRSIPMPP